MWLIPYTPGADHIIEIDCKEMVDIYGLRLWNYNKNRNDATRGVKRMTIKVDGQELPPTVGYFVRKAPGRNEFDFGQ